MLLVLQVAAADFVNCRSSSACLFQFAQQHSRLPVADLTACLRLQVAAATSGCDEEVQHPQHPETAPTAEPTALAGCRRRAPVKRKARDAQARSRAAAQPNFTEPSIMSIAAGHQAAGSTMPTTGMNSEAAAGQVLAWSNAGCV